MSEKFSPTLRIGDLNDFIAPSQACIISLKGIKGKSTSRQENPRQEEVVVRPPAAAKSLNTDPVRISLKDCLACSGCITSAETVMLEKQSTDEFLSAVRSRSFTIIVSISPQSRASLAEHFGLTSLQVLRKLTTFFKSLGVKAVFDTSCSRDLSLVESCNEFISRYKHQQSQCNNTSFLLPMLASSCPGWICYAEKTLGSYVLPYISSVKSPQQTIGSIIKRHMSQKIGSSPHEIHHVTIMPCYDKKLEAVRDDFVFEVDNEDGCHKITEVDSVLTSGEVLQLLESQSVDLLALEESPLDRLLTNVTGDGGQLYGVNGSSGGYAEIIFRHAAKVLFDKDLQGLPLQFKTLKNSDFREICLEVGGKVVLKFALCYGFRNLQNVVRKIKVGNCDYHFLEVMACPSGCLNGGGQIKPKQGQSAKDLIQDLETVYTKDIQVSDSFENPIVKGLYDEWLLQPGSEEAKRYIHTQYHPVEKSITSQLNW